MHSRRQFLHRGLGAVALGLLGPGPLADAAGRALSLDPRDPAVDGTDPILRIAADPPSVMVDGMPFAPWFSGDDFDNDHIPFHSAEDTYPNGQPPEPTEEADIVVIGGGLSGLCTAYLLRHHRPVLFELRPRFGGNAMGEQWRDVPYSLGSAYCITPDEGSFLDHLYRRLGLQHDHRVDQGENTYEVLGRLTNQLFNGDGVPAQDRPAFDRYSQMVSHFTENYPEIPLDPGADNAWILDLDRRNLREDITNRMQGMPIPRLLAAAIQSYCYSSFNAGWEEISAAAGWNFIAGEEFGRWVFPGGNAAMARALWEPLADADGRGRPGGSRRLLRAGCRVVDVRLAGGRHNGRAQVTWKEADGSYRSMLARRVVMANSKHIAKYMLHDLESIDLDKRHAMDQVDPVAYVVLNILLNRPIDRDFYDAFLLGDPASFPIGDVEPSQWWLAADMLRGDFAMRPRPRSRGVLTVYWPLPWGNSRFTLLIDDPFTTYARRAVPQVDRMLSLLGLNRSAVRQVRMTRFGHAMASARPGVYNADIPARLRRPIEGIIHFVNQDNWLLPAVETCLLEAQWAAEQIRRGL